MSYQSMKPPESWVRFIPFTFTKSGHAKTIAALILLESNEATAPSRNR